MDLNCSNTEEYIRLNNFAGNKIIALFIAQNTILYQYLVKIV